MVARTGTDYALAGQVFDFVALVIEATLPEPFVGDKPVEGVFQPPIVRRHHVVLEFAVVLTFSGVSPSAVTC